MKLNIKEVIDFINSCSPETKVYLGADSERLIDLGGRKVVDYLLVVVVHIDGCHGAKVFGEIQREFDYDKSLDKPRLRLMTEVYKICELYIRLAKEINQDIEIHLDVNPSPIHGSSCVLNEAIGYVKAICGKPPVVKPHSWCGTNVADQLKRIHQ